MRSESLQSIILIHTYSHLIVSLEYYIPITETIFIQSNMTYAKASPNPLAGSLHVGVNTNSSERQAVIQVDMTYTGTEIRERTSVCVVNLDGSDGLYIYVRISSDTRVLRF